MDRTRRQADSTKRGITLCSIVIYLGAHAARVLEFEGVAIKHASRVGSQVEGVAIKHAGRVLEFEGIGIKQASRVLEFEGVAIKHASRVRSQVEGPYKGLEK